MAGLSASGLITQIRNYTEVDSNVLTDAVVEKGLFPNIAATTGSVLSGLTLRRDIESPFIGFGSN